MSSLEELVPAAVVVAVVAWVLHLFFEQRKRLRDEALVLLQSADLTVDESGTRFKGSDAKILLEDVVCLGTSDGPFVSAKFLCKQPDSRLYSVLIETAHGDLKSEVHVSLLGSKEIEDLLSCYPYLSRLRKELAPPNLGGP